MPNVTPTIPTSITVHLGAPNQPAENVTVPFLDYVKNVASSEIYPTWPENAIRANMYAQISFALNRIFTEYYRSRGYDFDITNSTAYDQYFVRGRTIFDNISRIADDIFDSYVVKGEGIEPYFTQYCNGTTVTCDGLSQWGTVPLAEDGFLPYQILQYYYGDDVSIRQNVPIDDLPASYPGVPLRLGSVSNAVKNIQLRLNRISRNYPAIPKIYPTDGVFAVETEDAVKEFQRIFNLTPDGIVGRSTWYAVNRIFNAVKRLNELNSEGLRYSDISTAFPQTLREGDRSLAVQTLQYLLAYIAVFDNSVPPIPVTGFFGPQTRDAVLAFQSSRGLTPDGIVGAFTWDAIYDAYRGIILSQPSQSFANTPSPFPGTFLVRGSSGDDVRILQENLVTAATVWSEISPPSVTGYFGSATQNAVTAFQELEGIEPNGIVGPITWTALSLAAADIADGNLRVRSQFSPNT
ncbi:MAG: spore cortex-lytic protein [Ruminococcaceae bacterium]|nr:spore cortex-lytic protein [Oscillospiraceae bacterium]